MSGVHCPLKKFAANHPKALVGILFISIGLVLGGLLQYRSIIFIVLSCLGGFPLAIVYGRTIGLPAFVSCIVVVVLDSLLAYLALILIEFIRRYDRVKPYFIRLRSKYNPMKNRKTGFPLSRLGVVGLIVVSTMFIGWWLGVLISYFLKLKRKISIYYIILGLIFGAVFSWVVYSGLAMAIPNPLFLSIIFIGIFIVLTQIFDKILSKRKTNI